MKYTIQKPMKSILSLAVLGILAADCANAGGFALYTESSAAAIGNYAAGIAAEGADASIGWYNPAGLVLIRENQAVFGGVGVFPTSKLTGTSTYSTPVAPAPTVLRINETFTDLDGAKDGFVPSFHYALPLGDKATFGLSMVSPFGLSTEWATNSPVRYAATFTEVLTMNLSPELGAKITDNFAFGAGLDLQYARVKFNRMLGSPAFLQAFGQNPALFDSLSYNKGHSGGIGFHTGVLGMFNDNHTRVGLNYQSKMRHRFTGYSQLTGALAFPGLNLANPGTWATAANSNATFRNNGLFSNRVSLPDVITLSAYHDLNEKFALLGSVVYTGWSTFKTIELNGVAVGTTLPNSTAITQLTTNSVSTQNYRDTWRVALGANYHVNNEWMLRVGGGYDQTPTNNVDRDVRLPDADRWALSIGAHYQMRPNLGFDLGYTHLFAAETSVVNKTDLIGSSTYNVNASGNPSADLVGLQAVWTIDAPVPATTK